MMDDKKSFSRTKCIGDLALCVKGEADALCARPSF